MDNEDYLITDKEIEFLANADYLEEFPHLLQVMDQPKFTISDLQIPARDATYWDKQGVLPISKGPGMRRKYDLPQSIWLKLVQQMRSLGISLNTIKNLKDELLEPKIDVNKISPEVLSQILHQVSAKYDTTISVDQFLKEINENSTSVFNSIVLATIVFRKCYHCMVNKNGEYTLYEASRHQELVSKNEKFSNFISQPYFCISFSEAYKSLVKEWTPEPFITSISILSNTEVEILEMIRRKDVNSILIRYKKGEPDLIEIEEQKSVSIEQRFLDLIAKNGYQKINVTTQNGKIVHFENRIQKKLSKRTK
jgi:DNA-binding transcriptional MerR regulator